MKCLFHRICFVNVEGYVCFCIFLLNVLCTFETIQKLYIFWTKLTMFRKNVVEVYIFLEILQSYKITILENEFSKLTRASSTFLSATCHLSLQSHLHELYGAYSYKSSDRSSDENGRVRSYFRPLYSIPSWYSYRDRYQASVRRRFVVSRADARVFTETSLWKASIQLFRLVCKIASKVRSII